LYSEAKVHTAGYFFHMCSCYPFHAKKVLNFYIAAL